MAKPEVTQEARNAAAEFMRAAWHLFWPDDFNKAMVQAREIESGWNDNWLLVDSFHAAIQAAEQRGAKRERERCLREAEDADPLGKDAFGMREYIAQAIRQGEQA